MNNNNTKQPQVNQPLRRGGRMGGMFSGAKEKPNDYSKRKYNFIKR